MRVASLLIAAVLSGCAATRPAPRVVHAVGDTVRVEEFDCVVESSECTNYFINWIGQRTKATDNFVVVRLSLTNRAKVPVEPVFQPVLSLLDGDGRTYSVSDGQTAAINLGRSQFMPGLDSMNPDAPVTRTIVFEAPRRDYRLRIVAPALAQVGFAGSINVRGRFEQIALNPCR